eukprot:g343.t1
MHLKSFWQGLYSGVRQDWVCHQGLQDDDMSPEEEAAINLEVLQTIHETNGGKLRGRYGWKVGWDANASPDQWLGVTFDEFDRVTKLELQRNNLSGKLPDLTKLRRLKVVDLSSNKLEGDIPRTLSKLPQLEELDLGSYVGYNNKLKGRLPRDLLECRRIKKIVLINTAVRGDIPRAKKVGKVPAASIFTKCPNLEQLVLQGCREITGDMPEDIGNCKGLQVLDMRKCKKFTTNIQESIGQCVALKVLDLSYTKCVGEIPEAIGGCIALERLSTKGCTFLKGRLPTSLGKCRALQVLNLSDCPSFRGEIPAELRMCEKLAVLDLSGCEGLRGDLSELCEHRLPLRSLTHLFVFPAVSGVLSPKLGQCESLRELNMSECEFVQGDVPEEMRNLSKLSFVKLPPNVKPKALSRFDAEAVVNFVASSRAFYTMGMCLQRREAPGLGAYNSVPAMQ